VRNEFADYRNNGNLKVFWSGRSIHFMKSIHFRQNEEIHMSSGPVKCVRGRSVLHIVCLWELSYLLKTILPTTQFFSCVRNINFVQNCSIQVNGTSIISLVRKPSMWEAGGCSTKFPCGNWVNFWKKHCLTFSVFMCEEHELCTKLLLQVNEWTNVSLVKKPWM
jgi:hypothetical protein